MSERYNNAKLSASYSAYANYWCVALIAFLYGCSARTPHPNGPQGPVVPSADCPEPVIINWTNTWTNGDKTSLRVAKRGCKKYYGDESCLVKFTKRAEQTYRAICADGDLPII